MSGTAISTWIESRLERESDESLPFDAKLMILAALEGEEALADLAGFTPAGRSEDIEPEGTPKGAFLESITVRGFRGIGPQSTLTLTPGPSLTVISGRNGSGKSSFAEALEVALTSSTYRWRNRSTQWSGQWRNLHDGNPAHIEVAIAEEKVGRTVIRADWAAEADVDDVSLSLQRDSGRKESGIESLAWSTPLEMYRPLLTYEELGALLASQPSKLHDALFAVLGLEQLSTAVKLLASRRKVLEEPGKQLTADKNEILPQLTVLDDERARQAAKLLRKRTPDLDSLRGIATGTTAEHQSTETLREAVQVELPSQGECDEAAADLGAAVSTFANVGERAVETMARQQALATAALDLHGHAGDQICPVCETGDLDATGATRLRTFLDRSKAELADYHAAKQALSEARAAARARLRPLPECFREHFPEEIEVLAVDVRSGWSRWATTTDDSGEPLDDHAISSHLRQGPQSLRESLASFAESGRDYIRRQDEEWGAAANSLSAWIDRAHRCADGAAEAAQAKAAHEWLKANEQDLKNERLTPIADEAKTVWATLRQSSNVDIGSITFEGTNTKRHVAIGAEVDGQAAVGLSVMSQGELHSLALALFLPRATMDESPFRFVVLDDPVQAMDPAKVDGLVQVLLRIARDRQVVVFSHDDRFASAVRRAPRDVPVRVLEVGREADSRVSIAETLSPPQRYLSDAFALVKDAKLPTETLHRVLPGLLRMALEAEAREKFFARELGQGTVGTQVEEKWSSASTTRERVALAVPDPENSESWFTRQSYRNWAVRKANSVHKMLEHGSPIAACEDVRSAMRDIREGRK